MTLRCSIDFFDSNEHERSLVFRNAVKKLEVNSRFEANDNDLHLCINCDLISALINLSLKIIRKNRKNRFKEKARKFRK